MLDVHESFKMKTFEYSANLATSVQSRTLFTSIVLVLFAYQVVRRTDLVPRWSHAGFSISFGLLLFAILLNLGGFLFAAKSYHLNKECLTIVRRWKDKQIKIAEIREIRKFPDSETDMEVKLIGFTTMFGYFGTHYALKTGFVTLLATQRKNRILIQTFQGRRYIVTPDDLGLLNKLSEFVERKEFL